MNEPLVDLAVLGEDPPPDPVFVLGLEGEGGDQEERGDQGAWRGQGHWVGWHGSPVDLSSDTCPRPGGFRKDTMPPYLCGS